MKFKVGDRIKVYSVLEKCPKGTIKKIQLNGTLEVHLDRYSEIQAICAHPKQCRLIKKKQPKYYWINPRWIEQNIYAQEIGPMVLTTDGAQKAVVGTEKKDWIKVKVVKE